jgi:hypothetical protein
MLHARKPFIVFNLTMYNLWAKMGLDWVLMVITINWYPHVKPNYIKWLKMKIIKNLKL